MKKLILAASLLFSASAMAESMTINTNALIAVDLINVETKKESKYKFNRVMSAQYVECMVFVAEENAKVAFTVCQRTE